MHQAKSKYACVFLFALMVTVFPVSRIQAQDSKSTKPGATGYHLLQKIEVGGEGGWDYLTLDNEARRLYVSHATHVIVIDVDKAAIVGDIPNTNGVHGIAIASDLGRGFTSNGRDSKVTIFDLKTLKVLGEATVGKNPDAIIYDISTHRVFAFNRGSSDVTAIEAANGMVVGTIALGGHPEFATADGKGGVYVNLDDKSEVVALDSRKLTVKNRWSVAPGEDPSGMAIDSQHQRLFSVCGNKKMVVSDYIKGVVVTTVPIGTGTDAAAFDPGAKMIFSSNGEGTLTVVREDSGGKYSVVENASTQRGARTMAVDPKTHKVYLATAQFGPAPTATPERPNPRPTMVPGSFVILVFGK